MLNGEGNENGTKINRAFALTWTASMLIYWNKRKHLHDKDFNSQRIFWLHQHGRRFIVLEHQYDRRNVMWKRSIDLISKKKNKFARATRFLSFFAVVLHNYNAVL